MLPSQVINPRISSQREMITRKEGKFHPILTTSNNMIPYEAGQRVWIQDPASKKWNPGSIKEKATEPNSYWVELNGAEYRWDTNFIKPRQTQDIDPSSRASTEVHFSTSEASASGQATIQTSSVDAIPTEHTAITTTSDSKTSTTTPVKHYDAPARVSSRSNKGIAPRCCGFEEWHFSSIATIHMTCNFRVLTTFGHWNCLCFRFRVHKTEGLSNCNQSKDKLFFWRKGDVVLSTLFINLLTVLLFQHLFQIQYLRFYSTYQRVPSLSVAASPYSSFFSPYLAFIEISCVWINVVDIKPNLCLYTSFPANPTDSSGAIGHQTLITISWTYSWKVKEHLTFTYSIKD